MKGFFAVTLPSTSVLCPRLKYADCEVVKTWGQAAPRKQKGYFQIKHNKRIATPVRPAELKHACTRAAVRASRNSPDDADALPMHYMI